MRKLLLVALLFGICVVTATTTHAQGPEDDVVAQGVVCSDRGLLNVPNGDSYSVTVVAAGTVVDIIAQEQSTRWTLLEHEGQRGWVLAGTVQPLPRGAVVSDAEINLRSGSSIAHPVLTELPRGTTYNILAADNLAENGTWLRVYVPTLDIEGWLVWWAGPDYYTRTLCSASREGVDIDNGAIIVDRTANLFDADLGSGQIIDVLPQGTVLDVLASDVHPDLFNVYEPMVYVRNPATGQVGWMYHTRVMTFPALVEPDIWNLNARDLPGMDGAVQTTVSEGQCLRVVQGAFADEMVWYLTETLDQTPVGWIAADYVTESRNRWVACPQN